MTIVKQFKMKIILTSCLITLAVLFCNGQNQKRTLKTGTMEYCTGTDFCGKATYQFYIDPSTSSEIKHGTFKASGISKSDYGFSSFSISGQFIDGYRNGLWIFIQQRKDMPIQGGSFSTGKLKSTQSFKNGLPDGKWRLHEIWKTRDLFEINGKSVWGHFSDNIIDTAFTTFKDGIAVGITYCKRYGDESRATLNNNGFVTGNYIDPSSKSTFNSYGVMTKYEGQQIDTAVIRKVNMYLEGKISKSKLDELSIRVETTTDLLEFISGMFEQDFFKGAGGDKTMESQGQKRIYGRRIKVTW